MKFSEYDLATEITGDMTLLVYDPNEADVTKKVKRVTADALAGVSRKRYRALVTGDAETNNETGGNLVPGRIYVVSLFVAGDDFSSQQLLSGVVNTTGSIFRAVNNLGWTDSELSYDGSPYAVSKNANNELGPFEDGFDGAELTITAAGDYRLTKEGAFPEGKVLCFGQLAFDPLSADLDVRLNVNRLDDDNIRITTSKAVEAFGAYNQVLSNGILKGASIYIEVNP